MPDTKISPEQVNAQAAMHDEKRDAIKKELQTLHSETQAAQQASSSGMTKALVEACTSWVERVEKSVLDHMTMMADNIRSAAKDQSSVDEDNLNAIKSFDSDFHVPDGTKSFLGA